jgi:hypothetical protein
VDETAPPTLYYNLDESLIYVGGLNSSILPPETWAILRDFCLRNGITQTDLEKLYARLRHMLETEERPDTAAGRATLEVVRQVNIGSCLAATGAQFFVCSTESLGVLLSFAAIWCTAFVWSTKSLGVHHLRLVTKGLPDWPDVYGDDVTWLTIDLGSTRWR